MKPSHVFPPSLGSWICISASWSMVLQLLLWLPGPIHPQQTADEAGLIAVFSWRKLNTQSRGSFTALPAILLNCRRSCQSHDHAKPSYISKERLAKWSPWLLRGWHSRVLYSSPRKLPGWKKEAHASALGLLLLVTTLQKHFFQNSLSLVLKDPSPLKANCLQEWQRDPHSELTQWVTQRRVCLGPNLEAFFWF